MPECNLAYNKIMLHTRLQSGRYFCFGFCVSPPSSAGRPSGGPQIWAGSGVAGFVAQLVSPAGAAGQRSLAIAQPDFRIFLDLGAAGKSYILGGPSGPGNLGSPPKNWVPFGGQNKSYRKPPRQRNRNHQKQPKLHMKIWVSKIRLLLSAGGR